MNFVVTEGGGSVFAGTALTDNEGFAKDFWTLGFPGPQEVQVRAVDSKTGAKLVFATFEATAFGITTQSPLPDGVVGVTYSETLTAAGGSGTYTWALKSGSPPLPVGLILGADGVISGIPTAPGTVVITVEATSAELTAEKDLSITVHPGSTTTVTISSITISGTAGVVVVPTAVVGSIDVNLTIDEGTGTLIEAAVLFDGVVVGTQQFSTGAPAEDGPAAAVRPVTIQINTAAFAAGGTVTHLNGPKVVSATATTINAAGQKSTATATNSQTLTLVNPDVLLGALSSTGGTAVSVASQLWYGGSLTATITPVLYSGLTLGTLTVTYTDANVNAPAAGATVTATAAPWATTFSSTAVAPGCAAGSGPLCGHSSNPVLPDGLSVTGAAYTNGTVFALGTAAAPRAFIGGVPAIAAALAPVLTDNVAPIVTGVFNLTDQVIPVAPATASTVVCCSSNWINSSYTFASGLTTTADLDAFGVGGFAGVGGVVTTFHIGAATLPAAAVQAMPSAATAGAAGIAPSLLNTAYQLWVGLTDALGNVGFTSLAGAGSNGATTVGVDDTPPIGTVSPTTITEKTIIPAAAAGGAAHVSGFSFFNLVEDVSGFSAFPVHAWMTQDPSTTNGATSPFLIGASAVAGGAVNIPVSIAACVGAPAVLAIMNLAPCVPEFPTAPDAYYKMGGALMNQAGGIVPEIVRNWLIDQTAPMHTSNVSIPPTLTGGAPATFSTAVMDNVDLWSTSFAFDFGRFGSFIPFTDPVQLGDGNRWDGVRTTSAVAVLSVNFVVQLELTTAAFAPPVAGTSVLVTNVTTTTLDAAGNSSVSVTNNINPATLTPVTEYISQPVPITTFQVLAPAAAVTLCNGTGAAACAGGNVKTVTLNAEATGPTGIMPNPFLGGTIYYYLVTDDGDDVPYTTGPETWALLGTTPGSSATFTDDVVPPFLRHYNNIFILAGSHPALAALGAGPTPVVISVIGVNSSGAALITRFNLNITVVAGT